ncbi:prevent-host-death family protein [Nocardioides albertanoniae]|uniref:Antitoxin n=1 Tax=Nocardioides albertanoniae TaxID=1175486 RepID=A0A543A2D5_9ACTN|nr:type II toxin-antitoxin system prevent-host-death family antitoxin [Nocardioides albertanoniae]TQL66741.1 prevent-host-death family protein [Nocardioides albertanoniae]
MSEVRVGELNQQTGRVLRRVAEGESMVVTDHGRPVAMLVPVPKSKFKQLELLGHISKPRGTGRMPKIQRVKLSRSSEEILAEMREDRV